MTTATTSRSTSEASRYQQLRDHLNYLRLADAAAALPGVLDQAKTDNLSTTAALENLLRIEVQATEARRLTGRLRFANLPSPATLEDFDFDAQPGVDPTLIRDLASNRYLETASNILLIGPGSARRCSPSALPASAPKPGTAPISPTPPTSPPAATAPRWRAGGPPRCGSTPGRRAWSSIYADTATMPRGTRCDLAIVRIWHSRLGIVTGSRGTRGPCPTGGSGLVAPRWVW